MKLTENKTLINIRYYVLEEEKIIIIVDLRPIELLDNEILKYIIYS